MDGEKVTLSSREITVEAERQCAEDRRSGEPPLAAYRRV